MKTCFVVSPIGQKGSSIRKHADNVLNGLIRPVCTSLDYSVVRIDELAGSRSITNDIFKHLDNDDLVIADITDLNPNVLLELGYRIKTNLPFVIIRDSQDTNVTPFDISSIRYHEYGLLPDELDEAKLVLKDAIEQSKTENKGITVLGQGLYLRKEANGSVSLIKAKD